MSHGSTKLHVAVPDDAITKTRSSAIKKNRRQEMDGFANVMQSSGTIGDGGEHLSIA